MTPYSHFIDTELVTLIIQGDERAFAAIYQRYGADLYRYARKSIAVKEDCEEIIQEIFVNLWERHETLRHVTQLEPYLYRMVKYKVIRYFQHSQVKQRYAEHYKLFEAVYESAPVEEGASVSLKGMIEKGLEPLPERCRFAVMLRLNEGLSNGQIAERMNIKKTTVENYMVTAFQHLRTHCPHLVNHGT